MMNVANPVGIVTAKNVFKFYCNNIAKPVFELSSTDQAFFMKLNKVVAVPREIDCLV